MPKTKDDEPGTVPVVVSDTDEHGNKSAICLYDDHVEIGELRPLKDGAPIMSGRPVVLTGSGPCRDMQFLCDGGPREGGAPRKGPAKVNSLAFHAGWDSIFGKKEIGQA